MELKDRLFIILNELKNDNMDAFDELYALTKKSVYFAIYFVVKDESTTEDLMQETYIDFLEYKHKLKGNVDVIAYLVKSAKNKALNYYNKNKYEREYAAKYKSESYTNSKILDTGLLKTIKENLNENEYEVFVLKVLGEYSFKEISKLKKIPLGTATWLYQEARKKLQDKLGGMN